MSPDLRPPIRFTVQTPGVANPYWDPTYAGDVPIDGAGQLVALGIAPDSEVRRVICETSAGEALIVEGYPVLIGGRAQIRPYDYTTGRLIMEGYHSADSARWGQRGPRQLSELQRINYTFAAGEAMWLHLPHGGASTVRIIVSNDDVSALDWSLNAGMVYYQRTRQPLIAIDDTAAPLASESAMATGTLTRAEVGCEGQVVSFRNDSAGQRDISVHICASPGGSAGLGVT